ncbi:MAG TPA: hypothetical protein VLL52_02340 [Anaerolineae bacterium]|nr:hypothetical protein [Anaerolineae bacterium]
MSQSHRAVIGAILLVALLAFEVFNFDTTKFALSSLLGGVDFVGVSWAAILAIAFCAIDFAGLVYLFNPEVEAEGNKEGWALLGAWLLGATLNALMTWWAVSLTLLNTAVGNEIMSRAQLLRWAPILVATFVWLTRILFISSLSMAGQVLWQSAAVSSRNLGGTGPMGRGQRRQPTRAPVMGAERMVVPRVGARTGPVGSVASRAAAPVEAVAASPQSASGTTGGRKTASGTTGGRKTASSTTRKTSSATTKSGTTRKRSSGTTRKKGTETPVAAAGQAGGRGGGTRAERARMEYLVSEANPGAVRLQARGASGDKAMRV